MVPLGICFPQKTLYFVHNLCSVYPVDLYMPLQLRVLFLHEEYIFICVSLLGEG